MNGRPPPPPPPHGGYAKASGLPPGNYDIFIIPPHSAGSGFLYLPSLQPQRNSFLAGVASTLLVVGIWSITVPVLRQWTSTVVASGGVGVVLLVLGVGVLGWAFGKTQVENTGPGPGGGSTSSGGDQQSQAPPDANASSAESKPPPTAGGRAAPKPTWQQPNTGSTAGWEKAREETRKREDDRTRKEETEKKVREAAEKDKWEKARAREKENREKEAREKAIQDRLRREKEMKEKVEKEAKEKIEKEAREAKEKAEKEAKEAKEKVEAKEINTASAAGFAHKNYQKPTAQSYVGEDDGYSFRPYDHQKRPTKATSQSSILSESSSYAPSHSTARTTPPPSHRGPYSTKDPDKIQIKAVYAFNDLFPKPVAQLISGSGSVTDGLILKMTTEGLFIDDDVRGVPQREWDVKAWTMKLIEVWCPQFSARSATSASASALASAPAPAPAKPINKKDPLQRFLSGTAGGNAKPPALSSEETDLILDQLLRACKSTCSCFSHPHQQNPNSNVSAAPAALQSGELRGKHVLRASIRDADNKKYVFVIDESEAWKVAVGLQRLRRGTQVRSLGVSGMGPNEVKGILTALGWA